MKTVRVFCDECFEEVDAAVLAVDETVSMRGVNVPVRNEYPVCPQCGARIAANAFMDKNLAALYDQYRKLQDIPSPDAIRTLREDYGMSQRQFSALLGIGLASLQRYEKGSLPTDTHADLLKKARNPRYLKQRLKEDPKGLTAKDKHIMASLLDARTDRHEECRYYVMSLLDTLPASPSIFTGERAFNADRLRETIVYFALSVRDLYKTKLAKVLFFVDFSSFRDLGIGFTGLPYFHAGFGPEPDLYEAWMPAFVDNVSLEYLECEQGGQLVHSLREPDLSSFTQGEVSQMAKVADFANALPGIKAFLDASHAEDAWKNTAPNSPISYEWAKTLKGVG